MATSLDHTLVVCPKCPACGKRVSERLLIVPSVPVHVGLLWDSRDGARECPRGEIDLTMCRHCGYVWNDSFDISRLDYEQDYENSLHHSPKFAAWEAGLIAGLVDRYDLRGRRIAEIGCGDGRFLAGLCAAGDNSGVGFEPGHNPDRVSSSVAAADVRIIDRYANAESMQGHQVDFLVARHVLEHLSEPKTLVNVMRGGIAAGGAVYVEVPNFGWALGRRAFEDLMYEHCGYYTPDTLAHLLSNSGFSSLRLSETFDGVFAAVEATAGTTASVDDPIDPAITDEIRSQAKAMDDRVGSAAAEILRRHQDGERLVAWGGGARAVGLMNRVESSGFLECVVDLNPRKQGTFVAGSGHPIVAPEHLRSLRPDAVIVVNPTYKEEISRMLTEMALVVDLVCL